MEKQPVTIYISEKDHQFLKQLGEERGQSMSAMIRHWIMEKQRLHQEDSLHFGMLKEPQTDYGPGPEGSPHRTKKPGYDSEVLRVFVGPVEDSRRERIEKIADRLGQALGDDSLVDEIIRERRESDR